MVCSQHLEKLLKRLAGWLAQLQQMGRTRLLTQDASEKEACFEAAQVLRADDMGLFVCFARKGTPSLEKAL